MGSFALPLVVATAIAVSAPQAATPSVAPPPAVLFVRHVGNQRIQALERQLSDELGLVLDDFATFTLDAPGEDFWSLALEAQITQATPLVTRYDAVAAIWLTGSEGAGYYLHLVALQSGRTLVRTFEARRAAAIGTLALAVRELLGAAYMFEPPPPAVATALDPLVQSVVEELRQEHPLAPAPSATEVVPSESNRPRWRSVVTATTAGGLAGQRGPSTLWGASLAAELAYHRLWVSLGADLGWQSGEGAGLNFQRQVVQPRLAIAWQLTRGALAIAPGAALGVAFEQWSAAGEGPSQGFSRARVVVGADLQLRYPLTDTLAVVMIPGLSVAHQQLTLERRSDGRTAATTPELAWGLRLGVVLGL